MLKNIAVVGTGSWGINHVKSLKKLQEMKKVGRIHLCDSNAMIVADVARELNISSYTTDFQKILNRSDITAVVIVTPSDTHFELAMQAVRRGKSVLVEKPMCMNSEECKELIDTSEEENVVLMSGHLFRFHPAVRELKSRIDRGELGRIHLIETARQALPSRFRQDMDVFHALAVHDVDIPCYLLDEDYPKAVTTVGGNFYSGNCGYEVGYIMQQFSKALAFSQESWLHPTQKKRSLFVGGSLGSAEIDYLQPHTLRWYDAKITQEGAGSDNQGVRIVSTSVVGLEPLQMELKHFIECVEKKERPLSDGYVGMRAVIMIETCLESMHSGKTLQIIGI